MGFSRVRNVSFRIILIVLATLCGIAFQNCSEFSASTSNSKKSLTSQCLAKLRDGPLPAFDIKSVCEEVSNYACDRRIFKPGVGNGKKQILDCVSIDGWGETCLDVELFTYDTSVARGPNSENDPEFSEGGEYNREEVSCANRKVRSGELTLISTSGDSLEGALNEAVQRCRNGGGRL